MSNQPSYRLLAVDDNELNLGLFRLFLTQLGHDVLAINNPAEALDAVAGQDFDLIFTDIQMPGMSGIEAGAQMRALGFTGPIIAITAHLSELEEDTILNSTLDDVLIKPVSKRDLMAILSRWLEDESLQKPLSHTASASITAEQPAAQPILEHATDQAKPLDTYNGFEDAEEDTISDTEPALFDVALALERANHSTGLAVEMQKLLLDSLQEALPEIESQLPPDELSQLLHKILGGVRFSGAAKLEAELEYARQVLKYDDTVNIDTLSLQINELIDWAEQNPNPFEVES